MDHNEILNTLFHQADEIANEGHAGWGNTMSLAAESISSLLNQVKELEAENIKLKTMCGDI
jgi:hypothetical protein